MRPSVVSTPAFGHERRDLHADARRGAGLARERREGLDGAHGIDAAAAGLVRADRTVGDDDAGHQRADLGCRHDARVDADRALHRDVALDERDRIRTRGAGERDHARALEPDVAAGARGEAAVDAQRIARHRGELAIRVVLPQDRTRSPRRSGREPGLLEQHDRLLDRVAALREMARDRDAHHSPADDDGARSDRAHARMKLEKVPARRAGPSRGACKGETPFPTPMPCGEGDHTVRSRSSSMRSRAHLRGFGGERVENRWENRTTGGLEPPARAG
jgi:hypothetical protein